MASEPDHIACANRTQKTIDHLLADAATNSPWIASAAFYKALHIVEAVFANDRAIRHTSDHDQRDIKLKQTRKYEKIYKHYSVLKRASLNARYLANCTSFDAYMSPDDVTAILLKHHLRQVEASARQFLTHPDQLVGIEKTFLTDTATEPEL